MKNKFLTKRTLSTIALILVALFSIFVISRIASSAKFHESTINTLNEKQATVMGITAAAAASATALSAIPGDATTAIANQIMDTSANLLLVVCTIFLEKILITIFGYISFSILIPIACILLTIYLYTNKKFLKTIALKLTIFALAIFVLIPLSVKIGDLIEQTHQVTIQQTIDSAKSLESNKTEKTDEEKSWLTNVKDTVTQFTEKTFNSAKNMLENFINSIAVLLVTSLLIPVLVIFAFIGIVKLIFGINIKTPNFSHLRRNNHEHQKEITELR